MRLRIVDTPPDGWDLALRGHFRNLSLTYALTRADNDQPQQHEVSWAVHPTDASVRDRLAALDLLYAMSGAGTLRIQSCDRELPSMTIDLADCPLDAETLFERAFFTDLATLEDWSERQFELPEVASADQIQIVAAIATAIRTGGWHTTWERLTFSSPAEVPAKLDDWTAEDFPLPLEAEIFGEWVRFGFGRATIHFDIESIDPDPGDSTQRLLTVVPHGVGEHVVQVRGLEHVVLPLVAADESRPADHGGARGANRDGHVG
jgi:hypothetical protein